MVGRNQVPSEVEEIVNRSMNAQESLCLHAVYRSESSSALARIKSEVSRPSVYQS